MDRPGFHIWKHYPNLNQAEFAYIGFLIARTDRERLDNYEYLCALCIKACGNLTPTWQGGPKEGFWAQLQKARAAWVHRWVLAQLHDFHKDWGRYLPKRCKQALRDEIRKATTKKAKRARAEEIAKRETRSPEYVNVPQAVALMRPKPQSDETLAETLQKHQRFATTKSRLTKDELWLAAIAIHKAKPGVPTKVNKAEMARTLGTSEREVGRVMERVWVKLHLGWKERIAFGQNRAASGFPGNVRKQKSSRKIKVPKNKVCRIPAIFANR